MQVLVALGGNLNNQNVRPAQTLLLAIDQIEALGFAVEKCSRFFQTPAFPKGSGPDYVNAAIQLKIARRIAPEAILTAFAAIELSHGRQRIQRWGGRTLDIDLLAMDGLIWPDLSTYRHWAELDAMSQSQQVPESLILPHPRLADRAFVLVPMMDIAPDWRHPVVGKTVRQMLASLPKSDVDSVIALDA